MRRIFIYFTVASIILFTSFCTGLQEPDHNASLNQDDSITIKFGDTVGNNEGNFLLSFDEVIEDSRCPVDAVCVWTGNAKLRFSIDKEYDKASFILNTHGGVRFPQDTTIMGYTISLLDVKPYPHTDSTFTQNDYSAIISISK